METINGCTVIPRPELSGFVSLGPAETGGAYVLLIGGAPGAMEGPPLHAHPPTDEAFFVVEGEATFVLGDDELRLGPGSVVFVPRGMPHTVRNDADGPLRGTIVISPGDAEHVQVAVEGERSPSAPTQ